MTERSKKILERAKRLLCVQEAIVNKDFGLKHKCPINPIEVYTSDILDTYDTIESLLEANEKLIIALRKIIEDSPIQRVSVIAHNAVTGNDELMAKLAGEE